MLDRWEALLCVLAVGTVGYLVVDRADIEKEKDSLNSGTTSLRIQAVPCTPAGLPQEVLDKIPVRILEEQVRRKKAKKPKADPDSPAVKPPIVELPPPFNTPEPLTIVPREQSESQPPPPAPRPPAVPVGPQDEHEPDSSDQDDGDDRSADRPREGREGQRNESPTRERDRSRDRRRAGRDSSDQNDEREGDRRHNKNRRDDG